MLCIVLPYKAFSYYYEVMKLFNITDVYDDHTGWSMMEHDGAECDFIL